MQRSINCVLSALAVCASAFAFPALAGQGPHVSVMGQPSKVDPQAKIRSLAAQNRFPLTLASEPGLIALPRSGFEPVRKAFEPLSVIPINPRTLVSQTPSGSIVLTTPQDWLFARAGRRSSRKAEHTLRPLAYAQPVFHVLGQPSHQHMATSVRLTHGIQLPRRFKTEPKVIFLSAKGKETAKAER